MRWRNWGSQWVKVFLKTVETPKLFLFQPCSPPAFVVLLHSSSCPNNGQVIISHRKERCKKVVMKKTFKKFLCIWMEIIFLVYCFQLTFSLTVVHIWTVPWPCLPPWQNTRHTVMTIFYEKPKLTHNKPVMTSLWLEMFASHLSFQREGNLIDGSINACARHLIW